MAENILLEDFLNAICVTQCFINQRIVLPQNLLTTPSKESLLVQIQHKLQKFEKENQFENDHTNTVNYEEKISFCIKNGDLEALTELLESFSHTLNRLGPNALRHFKNASIILNSLALRAAIAGGVNSDICYKLGGLYIIEIESSVSIHSLSSVSSTMMKDYCLRVQNIHSLHTISNKINDNEINKCINYIGDHFREKLSISDIAQNIGYSPEYLSSKFKRITGKNLPHYINELKMADAQRKLVLTDLSISDISEQLSFSNQSYFQKIFKDVIGMTPLNYRKANGLIKKNKI